MKSFEVLKQATAKRGIKAVASELGISESLLYKWCQDPGPGGSEPEGSGTLNPLDRSMQLLESTQDTAIVEWFCQRAGGFFVRNPNAHPENDVDAAVFRDTQELISHFSELLEQVSNAIENGDGVDEREAKHIRRDWEALKRRAEAFTVRCEHGRYYKGHRDGQKK